MMKKKKSLVHAPFPFPDRGLRNDSHEFVAHNSSCSLGTPMSALDRSFGEWCAMRHVDYSCDYSRESNAKGASSEHRGRQMLFGGTNSGCHQPSLSSGPPSSFDQGPRTPEASGTVGGTKKAESTKDGDALVRVRGESSSWWTQDLLQRTAERCNRFYGRQEQATKQANPVIWSNRLSMRPSRDDAIRYLHVDKVAAATLQPCDFYAYLRKSVPVIITGLGRERHLRQALLHWTDTYLAQLAGDQTVEVEVSADARFASHVNGFRRQPMRFDHFLKVYGRPENADRMYVAQWDLPPPLAADITNPTFANFLEVKSKKLWMTAGTVESLPHTDGDENLLVMLDGRKTVRLVSPTQRRQVYAGQASDSPPNYSGVDFFAPDLKQYPLFKDARVWTAELEAGDALFIPAYWWHHVKSESRHQQGHTGQVARTLAVNLWYHNHHRVYQQLMIAWEDMHKTK